MYLLQLMVLTNKNKLFMFKTILRNIISEIYENINVMIYYIRSITK